MTASRGSPPLRRHRRALAALAGLALALSAAPAAADLTPHLEARLAAAAVNEPIPVIVTLEAQLAPGHRGRTLGRIADQRALAAQTQPAVVRAAGVRARRFWIANAIALSASPALVRRLARHPAVASVGLDPVIRAVGEAPDPPAAAIPPLLSVQAIESAPAPGAGAAVTLDAIRARDAWREFGVSGAGIRVGSIDTGVDPTNPEVAGRIVAWRDFVNGQPAPYDDHGHGTHTIGTMIGAGAAGAPIGVAPGATVVVAKALGADGLGLGSDLLAAAEWMTDPDGDPKTDDFPAVVDNSWTGDDANDVWYQKVVQSWIALGIVPVFAAGNRGPGPSTIPSPASYPSTIAVAAVDETWTVAAFSGRGPVVWMNAGGAGPAAGTLLAKPDLAAPGVHVLSATGQGYGLQSGTSPAAAHVAGVVALVRQANPGLRPQQIAQLLRDTAVDLGPPGPDADSGAGLVDALAAVARALGRPVPTIPAPAPAPVPAPEPELDLEPDATPDPGEAKDPHAVPAPALPGPDPLPRPRATAAALEPVAIRDVRLAMRTRGGSRSLVVRGRLTRAARVRVVLLAVGRTGTVRRAGAVAAERTMRRGAFELTLPLARGRTGPHRLIMTPRDGRGRPAGPSLTRAVRVAAPAGG
jgi:bacillopeptidase F